MRNKKTILLLSIITGILAAITAAGAIILEDGGDHFVFETLRGQSVEVYGGGLYHYDTLFFREGNRASDILLLVLDLPLLALTLYYSQKGSWKAQLWLSGTIAYFLYLFASLALGTAYNQFFLLYIGALSTSLFAFITIFTSFQLPDRVVKMPKKSVSGFMIVAGVITLLVWCEPLITALFTDQAPLRMDSYTTMVTYVLDLAVITPATFICAWNIIKNNMLGYKLAIVLLIIIILLVPQIVLSTYFQYTGGVSFSMGEMIGPVSGFLVLGMAALWLMRKIMKSLEKHTDWVG